MKLTPLDIRKQEFTRAFRGYEVTEVQAFLQTVSEQWQQLLDEQRRQAERIRELEEKLAHYRRIEEALQQALETARENARQTLEQAERKARLLLEEAQARADEIRWQAEQERRRLQQRIAELVERRDELIARLRAFLRAEMEVLTKFEERAQEPQPETAALHATAEPATEAVPAEAPARPAEEPEALAPSESAESAPEEQAPPAPTQAEGAEGTPASEEPPVVPRFATFQPESEATEAAPAASEPPAPPEPPTERKGWTVRSIVGTPPASQTPDEPGENPPRSSEQVNEEFEKIRRILKDLD